VTAPALVAGLASHAAIDKEPNQGGWIDIDSVHYTVTR